MTLLDLRINQVAWRLFEIEIQINCSTTRTFKMPFQPILNINHIRQRIKIKNSDEIILSGSKKTKIENDIGK